jgi:hypothetical protein
MRNISCLTTLLILFISRVATSTNVASHATTPSLNALELIEYSAGRTASPSFSASDGIAAGVKDQISSCSGGATYPSLGRSKWMRCSSGVVWEAASGSTPTPLPSGVPTPPAIPPTPALNNPTTVGPGTHGVVGNGVTDDTAAWQVLLNNGDVIVEPGTYAIAGNLSIPTGRNISCQPGATFLDTQSKSTRMFQIGYSAGSLGNASMVGCTLKGTDSPAGTNNYANYQGGTSGYSVLFEIVSGWGVHIDNVLIENNDFLDGQGDALITYSPCGTANTGAPCNSGAPGTEGPSNITVYNNSFTHCAQPGLHFNGGQNLHAANNTFTDCGGDDEEDPGVLQVMTGVFWNNNTFNTTSFGMWNPLNDTNVGSLHSCMGSDYIASNGTGCWSMNNLLEGATSGGSSTQLFEGNSTCDGGLFKPGNYSDNLVTGGAFTNTGC